MNRLSKIIACLILLTSSCKDSNDVQHDSPEFKDAAKLNKIPIHKNIQFFISLGSPEVQQGARMMPNLDALDSKSARESWSMSYVPENIPSNKYELTATYLGSSAIVDKYEIELIYPTAKGRKKGRFAVNYKGEIIIMHKDNRQNGYVVGVRPTKKRQNKVQ